MAVYKTSQVPHEQMNRFSFYEDEMDWFYGRKGDWGCPNERISVWTGASGVGKTRLLTQLMREWDKRGLSSCIAQGEVSAAQFKAEKLDGKDYDNILICDDMCIDDQVDAIRTHAPNVFITDSVQQVEQYKNGKGAKDIVRKLRKVLSVTKTHLIFISQMTVGGTTRGGTELPHEADVVVYLNHFSELTPSLRVMDMYKNRYGPTGKELIFAHKDWGCEFQSRNRMKDPDWVADHRIATPGRKKLFGMF